MSTIFLKKISIVFSIYQLSSARDILPCAPPLPPNGGSSSNIISLNNTGGLNYISLYACSSIQPTNETCNPDASSAVLSCGLYLNPNATSYINITLSSGKLTAVTVQWHSSNPFSYHAIKSSPPLSILWPPPGDRGFIIIPYPSKDAILCDVDEDCPRGIKCNTALTQPQCATYIPSPLPSPPPPNPVPSPSPGPRASICNLTSQDWVQSNLGEIGYQHEGDAFITMIMSSTISGQFSFLCKASKGKCPYNSPLLNGTGLLSKTDNTFTLTPTYPSGLLPITGYVNNTYTCSALTLVGNLPEPLSWSFYGSNPEPHNFNLDISVSTFLGIGDKNFVATGIAILQSQPSSSVSIIAISGNGQSTFGVSLTPTLLLGASINSNGTIVLIKADILSTSPSKPTVVAIYKVGDRIDHIRSNSISEVAIAGSFGIAKVENLLDAGKISWNDNLVNIQPGSCGICCTEGSTNITCRVDIGDDGVIAASFASFAIDNSGWLWGVYDVKGERILQKTTPAALLTDVFVNSEQKLVGSSIEYNSNTGKEPMVMPRVITFSYTTPSNPSLAWELFPWSASVYRSPGPCDGNVADGRILAVRVARDGNFLIAGRSDGGDSPWFCGTRNSSRQVPFISFDQYTSGYNMASQAIANIIRADPATGESIEGEIILTRLPEAPFKGNTLLTQALQSDTQGNIFLLQNAACCIPNMLNLTVNNQPLSGYGDGATLQVLSSDFKTRRHWTHFTSATSKSGGSTPIDIDIRGQTVAAIMQANAEMIEVNPLTGTSNSVGGAPTGYLILLPATA
jgi:hypothetical protein